MLLDVAVVCVGLALVLYRPLLHDGPTIESAALASLALFAAYRVLRLARRAWLTVRAVSPIPLMSRLMANIVRSYSYTEEDMYGADGAPDTVQALRRAGMNELSRRFDASTARARELNEQLRALSDIRFTDTNRVPHAFQSVVRQKLRLGCVVARSEGPFIVDVDGNRALDVSGSYGVNVHGYDFYKECLHEGQQRVGELGPNVLGPLHPCIFPVLQHLTAISQQEEVSFHMSGTEAVMAAVRLCRFNTRRKLIVQFAGAYHGWWDGVQPGPGNERDTRDTLTLRDLSPHSLALIRARRHEIAAVLVSPLQGFSPGSPPPTDVVLLDAAVRDTSGKGAYRAWLGRRAGRM